MTFTGANPERGHEFHLHYWEMAGATPEFACVGPHNHFDIPYCR